MTLEQFDHVCALPPLLSVSKEFILSAPMQLFRKIFDFAVSVAQLFPMTDNVLNDLVEEFRAVHPLPKISSPTRLKSPALNAGLRAISQCHWVMIAGRIFIMSFRRQKSPARMPEILLPTIFVTSGKWSASDHRQRLDSIICNECC